MPSILLVENDEDAHRLIKLALEPRVNVHIIVSLHKALNFLRNPPRDVCGVIVDLNLTDGTDNFGRVLLERLREMNIPCVVFSASIKSPDDARRYENEFGVLGAIGKSAAGAQGGDPLQQLRDSVDRMIAASLEQLRERVRGEVEREIGRLDADNERERNRSAELIAEAERIAGKQAATKLANKESTRIQELTDRTQRIRHEILDEINGAKTIEDLENVRATKLRALGAM